MNENKVDAWNVLTIFNPDTFSMKNLFVFVFSVENNEALEKMSTLNNTQAFLIRT